MKSTKVASRYAKSLLELAIEQNKVDAILGDMNFLLETNESTRDFELLINTGQMLSIPFIIAGIILIYRSQKNQEKTL